MLAAVVALLLQTHAPPTFQSSVDVVKLTLTVQNTRSGKYSLDLKPEDIVLKDRGVQQQITFFTPEQLPISLTILIDSSTSMLTKIDATKIAAINFINKIRPQDEARISQFSDTSRIVQDFTSDRALLTAGINSIEVHDTTTLNLALYIAIKDLVKRSPEVRRRRAIIVLTDGDDTGSPVTEDQVVELAYKSEVNIFAITLETYDPTIESKSAVHGQQFLKKLSDDTGGELFRIHDIRELNGQYEKIASELSVQYSIGYVASNPSESKLRDISITIPKLQNSKLQYRRFYIPTKNRR